MSWVKQHVAALVAAILAVIFLIIGVLSITVLRPAQEVVASASVNQPYVMTRSGLLPVLGPNPTVSVSAQSGGTVVMAYGTSADVKGWIGGSGYNEVVGIKSGMEELMLEDHPAQSGEPGQSGDGLGSQSGQSGAQTGQTPQSGLQSGAQSGSAGEADGEEAAKLEENESPAGSDMWLEQQSGLGSATMNLTAVGSDRSILAAVEGGDGPETITITWAVERSNGWGVACFALGGVFAVVAVILFLISALHRSHHRDARKGKRAGVHSDHPGADVASTPEERVAILKDADQTATTQLDAGQIKAVSEQDTTDHQDERAQSAPAPQGQEPKAITGRHALVGLTALADPDLEPKAEEDLGQAAQISPVPSDQEPEAITGRHALIGQGNNANQKSGEEVSTDTGIIDLSRIRPGIVLPSRRALREARERGEQRITVGGHEFQTGLIPKIPETSADPRQTSPVQSRRSNGDTNPAGHTGKDSPTRRGPDFEQRTIDRGGWDSLMDRWTNKGGSDEA